MPAARMTSASNVRLKKPRSSICGVGSNSSAPLIRGTGKTSNSPPATCERRPSRRLLDSIGSFSDERTPPAGEQPARGVLGGDGITDVVSPGAVDVHFAYPDALAAEPELLHDAPGGSVLRAHGRHESVQPHHEEAVIDRHRERCWRDCAPGELLIDPV